MTRATSWLLCTWLVKILSYSWVQRGFCMRVLFNSQDLCKAGEAKLSACACEYACVGPTRYSPYSSHTPTKEQNSLTFPRLLRGHGHTDASALSSPQAVPPEGNTSPRTQALHNGTLWPKREQLNAGGFSYRVPSIDAHTAHPNR